LSRKNSKTKKSLNKCQRTGYFLSSPYWINSEPLFGEKLEKGWILKRCSQTLSFTGANSPIIDK